MRTEEDFNAGCNELSLVLGRQVKVQAKIQSFKITTEKESRSASMMGTHKHVYTDNWSVFEELH